MDKAHPKPTSTTMDTKGTMATMCKILGYRQTTPSRKPTTLTALNRKPHSPIRLTAFAQGVPATKYPMGENIARPGHRLRGQKHCPSRTLTSSQSARLGRVHLKGMNQVGDHAWVVPVSGKRADGHNVQNLGLRPKPSPPHGKTASTESPHPAKAKPFSPRRRGIAEKANGKTSWFPTTDIRILYSRQPRHNNTQPKTHGPHSL